MFDTMMSADLDDTVTRTLFIGVVFDDGDTFEDVVTTDWKPEDVGLFLAANMPSIEGIVIVEL